MSTTRFGRQPARDVIFLKRWSVVGLAAELGVKHAHLNQAIRGRVRPAPRLRERLPELLGVPLEELFTAEALERPYGSLPDRSLVVDE
ncbi:MAG TPA: helix-turn-helix transcriptional regulator [Micromonosporaceae bacterium]|nr:helix-turn-helix transcriptional regulator [Micromonosporaceae bacterium]